MSFSRGFSAFLPPWRFGRKHGKAWLGVTDFIAPLAALAAGRLVISSMGTLGRAADPALPWAMIFPQAGDALPRHPSQIHHLGLEGLALFAIGCLFVPRSAGRCGFRARSWRATGVFDLSPSISADPTRGFWSFLHTVSMGQWLSLPMIVADVWLIFAAYRSRNT